MGTMERILRNIAKAPGKWIALLVTLFVVVFFIIVPAITRKSVDPETRRMATLFRDDEFASQYTFLTGALIGIQDKQKVVLRIGYFMNYAAYYRLPENDDKALISILSESLAAAGAASLKAEPGELLRGKKTMQSNEFPEHYRRFEERVIASLGTNIAPYRIGDALWHAIYAVHSRKPLSAEHEAVLAASTNAYLRNIVASYRELSFGTNSRSAVKNLIRGYVAE